MSAAGFALLQRFLRDNSGFALDDDKGYLLDDRLASVLRTARLSGIDDLAQALHARPRSDLAQLVIEALTINETSFFRDRALFNVFADRLLPEMMAARKGGQRHLRIWCAGCSTGQEPYSLAMLIEENSRQFSGWQIEILATDLSRSVIESAKRGVYSQFEVQRGLPIAMLLRYFHRDRDGWRINDPLRSKVSFKTYNLMMPAHEFGRFDLILCRNVLIYFDVAIKRRVLANLTDALTSDGRLVLGAAESVTGLSDVLQPDANNFIFRKAPRATSRVATQRIWA